MSILKSVFQDRLVYCLLAIVGLTLIGSSAHASCSSGVGIENGVYGTNQTFDVSRAPAYPTAGLLFNIFSMNTPLNDSGANYTIGSGEYIQFFYVNGSCSGGLVGINLMSSTGALIQIISNGGMIRGIGDEGFLFESTNGNYGTFISNSQGFMIGDSVSYTPTVTQASCMDLATMNINTSPLAIGENCGSSTGTSCGNGTLDMGEMCDDANTGSSDGCSSSCLVETGYSCLGMGPSVCTPLSSVCGDGLVQTGEVCDDANTGSSDGCSSSCLVETGYSCTGIAPSSCSPTIMCGNSTLEMGEGCDFGDIIPGDGCSATCEVEPGYVCGMTSCSSFLNGGSFAPTLADNSITTSATIYNSIPTSTSSKLKLDILVPTSNIDMVGCMAYKETKKALMDAATFISEEHRSAVDFLVTYDFTSIDSIKNFEPNSFLTRSQGAKFLVLFAQKVFCKQADQTIKVEYSDLSETDASSQNFIIQAKQLGIMNGAGEDKFYPNEKITRNQFVLGVMRMVFEDDINEYSNKPGDKYFDLMSLLGLTYDESDTSPITRAEIADILFRIYGFKKNSISSS